MGLIKNLWRRFQGGPDFSNCVEVTALLEDWRLNLTVPSTNIITEEEPQNINYPYNQSGWFEANSKQSRQHHYVHIDTQLWYYLPINSLYQTELGLFSLSIQLKKILPEKNTNAMDLEALGRYVVAEYDEYYNAPMDSPIGGGANTRRRKKVEDAVRRMCGKNVKEEDIQAKIQLRLPEPPYPPIPPHEIRVINGRDWVFYVEQNSPSQSRDNMYCQPLSEQYYLCLNFRHRVDWPPKYKYWKDHAIAAEDKIMDMVRLEKINSVPMLEQASGIN